jgi:hypothetical protein
MAKGFRSLGHSVEEYNYRTKLKELGSEGMHKDFMSLINGRKFDLQIYCKVNQMNPVTLDLAKEAGPTWYWFMDNLGAAKQFSASTYAQNASFTSATASDVAERFGMVNSNAHHIFEGYDPDVYYYEDLKKIHDVIFIGNVTIPRIIEINSLRSVGIDITIFGYGWPIGMKANGPVVGEDERVEINQSRMVLNLCHDDTIFSDRVIKSLGCGAMVVSQVCKDLLSGFIGERVHFYQSPENFSQIISSLRMLEFNKTQANRVSEKCSWKTVCALIEEKVGA